MYQNLPNEEDNEEEDWGRLTDRIENTE
jgi:hypothetical protein